MTSTSTSDRPHDQASRTSRHLAMLEKMAAIAMALACAAAEKARAHLEHPAPEPGQANEPDPALAFTRLARTVRQIIALEARIAGPTPLPPIPPLRDLTEPRHLIAEAVRTCAKADPAATVRHGPAHAQIDRYIDERIDADDITRLIGRNANVAEIIERICNSLGIHFDITQQPVENLLPLSEATTLKRQIHPLPPTEQHAKGSPNTPTSTPQPRSRDPT